MSIKQLIRRSLLTKLTLLSIIFAPSKSVKAFLVLVGIFAIHLNTFAQCLYSGEDISIINQEQKKSLILEEEPKFKTVPYFPEFDCSTDFFSLDENGIIQRWSLINGSITGGETILTDGEGSLSFCGEPDAPTFYSGVYDGTGLVQYDMDLDEWTSVPLSEDIYISNSDGYENDHFLMVAPGQNNRDLYHFNGTDLTLVDTVNFFTVYALAVDNNGHAWAFSGSVSNSTDLLRVYNSSGLLTTYDISFNSGNSYGSMFLNGTLYVAFGSSNVDLANTLVPVIINEDEGTAELGTPIPFPYMGYYDLSSCQENTVSLPDCLDLSLDIGDACDDNNQLTINDTVQEDCTCLGVIDNCLENPIEFNIEAVCNGDFYSLDDIIVFYISINGGAPEDDPNEIYSLSGTWNFTSNLQNQPIILNGNGAETQVDIIVTDNFGCSTQFSEIFICYVDFPYVAIELSNFAVDAQNKMNHITWTTLTETNNDYFEVQRSVDGLEFIGIGQVDGASNSISELNYELKDFNLIDRTYYYRLKSVDFNNTFEYSDVVMVDRSDGISPEHIGIYPNPFQDILYVDHPHAQSLSLFGSDGQLILSKRLFSINQKINLAYLNSGIYFIQLNDSSGLQLEAFRIIKD